jgi:hypothetical protein
MCQHPEHKEKRMIVVGIIFSYFAIVHNISIIHHLFIASLSIILFIQLCCCHVQLAAFIGRGVWLTYFRVLFLFKMMMELSCKIIYKTHIMALLWHLSSSSLLIIIGCLCAIKYSFLGTVPYTILYHAMSSSALWGTMEGDFGWWHAHK